MRIKPNNYWTLNRCKDEALKYETIGNWRKFSGGSYMASYRNGWIEECVDHMKPIGNKFKRLVYAFEFSDNFVYIGLTYNIQKRKRQHFSSHNKSSVYDHFIKTKIDPKLILLTEYIDINSAKINEKMFVKNYKNDGWNILNKIKTGGIGGNSIKYSKEICLEDAKKYNTRTDWRKFSNSCYVTSSHNKWLSDCTKHMRRLKKPNRQWSKIECIEDAKKYKNRTEWSKSSRGPYTKACKMGWLSEC